MKAKDGGPAFPMQPYRIDLGDGGYSESVFPQFGMTLRDYFAGQSMAAMALWLTQQFKGDPDFEKHLALCAEAAYKQADVMLKAREEEV